MTQGSQRWLAVAPPSESDSWPSGQMLCLGVETAASKESQVGSSQPWGLGLKCLWFDLER